jgi:hypothetical protein
VKVARERSSTRGKYVDLALKQKKKAATAAKKTATLAHKKDASVAKKEDGIGQKRKQPPGQFGTMCVCECVCVVVGVVVVVCHTCVYLGERSVIIWLPVHVCVQPS